MLLSIWNKSNHAENGVHWSQKTHRDAVDAASVGMMPRVDIFQGRLQFPLEINLPYLSSIFITLLSIFYIEVHSAQLENGQEFAVVPTVLLPYSYSAWKYPGIYICSKCRLAAALEKKSLKSLRKVKLGTASIHTYSMRKQDDLSGSTELELIVFKPLQLKEALIF